jgi:hypothetical protein
LQTKDELNTSKNASRTSTKQSLSPQELSCLSEEERVSTCMKCKQEPKPTEIVNEFLVQKMMTSKNKNQSFVFNEKFQQKRAKYQQVFEKEINKCINRMKSQFNEIKFNNEYKFFNKILYKFLTNKQITKCDIMTLSEWEMTSLKMYIKHKKVYFRKEPEYYFQHPEKIKQLKNIKRVEENLKFIFRKLFKFLREVFNNTFRNTLIPYLNPKYKNSIRCDDYAFYGFFFEEASLRLDTKIEKFFEPSIPKFDDGKDDCTKLVRKTISKLYLKCVKNSEFFMIFLNKFIDNVLIDDIQTSIQNKLNMIISDWNPKSMGEQGQEERQIKKLKFAWTVKDMEVGIKHLFEYLGDISD